MREPIHLVHISNNDAAHFFTLFCCCCCCSYPLLVFLLLFSYNYFFVSIVNIHLSIYLFIYLINIEFSTELQKLFLKSDTVTQNTWLYQIKFQFSIVVMEIIQINEMCALNGFSLHTNATKLSDFKKFNCNTEHVYVM